MELVRVSALFRSRVRKDLREFRPTHVVSLVDPMASLDIVQEALDGARHVQGRFFDGDAPTGTPIEVGVLRRLLSFTGEWAEDVRLEKRARLLVHCHMGASRSTAMAYLAIAQLRGGGSEELAFRELLRITNKPWPNLPMVRMADEILGSEGRLLAPLDSYRARFPARKLAYRRLNVRRGLV
jgi:predicted protein tyrosine phosphatase